MRDIPNEAAYSTTGDYMKTAAMLECERRVNALHNLTPDSESYMEIHELILDAIRRHNSDRLAANSLGLLAPPFSKWIVRCGISLPASRIRTSRSKRVNQYA